MQYPSTHITQAVDVIRKLPGVGPKSALRMVLHLLKTDATYTTQLTAALDQLRHETQYCERCFHIADAPLCVVCNNPQRQQKVVCVVESLQDVLAIENTAQYRGTYHVLGGIIAPIEGVGPEQLKIAPLVQRVREQGVTEIIFALRATIEGDTTAFYIAKLLKDLPVRVSTLARGIAVGGELEYTDEVTLGRSIAERVTYGSLPAKAT